MNRVEVDSLEKFDFKKLSKIYYSDFEDEPNDTIMADLIVNSDSTRDIRLVKANVKGDTLRILIYQTDPAYHHEYMITIIRDRYFIKYKFLMSGDTEDNGEVIPIQTKLKLNTLNFSKKKEICGYTEFKGRCMESCDGLIVVKGNFKAIVK